MIHVTFQLNGISFNDKLSTYNVKMLYEYPVVVPTMDGTEHVHQRRRPSITFSVIPLTAAEIKTLYDCLKNATVNVRYLDTYTNNNVNAVMRCETDLSHIFALDSVTGYRYYKGTEITLRQPPTV